MVLRIGLTGGIASGKSAVADLLAAHGALVVDADVLAREAVAPGTPGLKAVLDRFGDRVRAPDGTLDRGALGEVVFADPRARVDLEAIIHPEVRRRAIELEARAPAGSIVVHVIPLLVETGQAGRFDAVVVVDCPEGTQLRRLMARNGLSLDQALARLAAQVPRAERLAAADVVIANDGSLDDLQQTVDAAWPVLIATARDRWARRTVGGSA